MSKIVLYGTDMSPPVRTCLLTLKALGVPFEYKIVDLMAGEHLSEEFTKHNPQHTVPVLDDNGTWIWDSHAINGYLVDKYGRDDSLYPKDLAARAVVNQRMYFDASILFMALRNVTRPLFLTKTTVVLKAKTDSIKEGYDLVEKFLGERPYITGDTLTIADFCCVATVTTLRGIIDLDASRYPKTLAWVERLAQLPYYEEANGKGAQQITAFLRSSLTDIIK